MSPRTTTRTDPQGRPTFAQIAGVEAVNYGYDVRGRITGVTQGSGADLRSLTIGYGSDGFVQTITDALTRQVVYQRDLAGRVTQTTLPGSRIVGFGFDANGNVTAITPPGRTPHSFGLNAVDLEDTYTPPAAGLPVSKTEYRYNLDKQLTDVIRPDGSTITVGYDSGGRLGTITPTTGTGNTVTYGYNPTSGQLSTLANTSRILRGQRQLFYAHTGHRVKHQLATDNDFANNTPRRSPSGAPFRPKSRHDPRQR